MCVSSWLCVCVCLKRKQRKSTRGATKTIIHIQKLFAIPPCTHTRAHPYRMYSHTFHLQVKCTVIKRNCNEKTSRNRHTHAILVVQQWKKNEKKQWQQQQQKINCYWTSKGAATRTTTTKTSNSCCFNLGCGCVCHIFAAVIPCLAHF